MPVRYGGRSEPQRVAPLPGLAFSAAGLYLIGMTLRGWTEEDADGDRQSTGTADSRSRRTKPRRFGDLPDGAWAKIARRSWDRFGANGGTNLAGSLTYRSVLSLFPALLIFAGAVQIRPGAQWPAGVVGRQAARRRPRRDQRLAGRPMAVNGGGRHQAGRGPLLPHSQRSTAIAVGAQIDAEIERERELDAGIDAHERIQLPVRDSS